MITIDPRRETFSVWASQTNCILDQDLPIGPERSWKKWAKEIVLVPMVADKAPPRPEFFRDWRTWAMLFNQALALVEEDAHSAAS